MAKKKEPEFEKLARLIKEEGEDTRSELRAEMKDLENRLGTRVDRLGTRIDGVDRKVDVGFATIVRRLDKIIQMQLDEHASRIKTLETLVLAK